VLWPGVLGVRARWVSRVPCSAGSTVLLQIDDLHTTLLRHRIVSQRSRLRLTRFRSLYRNVSVAAFARQHINVQMTRQNVGAQVPAFEAYRPGLH
jgi:hypothetical protein